MRTLLFITALLAAAPAMAGGHRSHDVDRTHVTASRAHGGAAAQRNRAAAHSRSVHNRRPAAHTRAPAHRTRANVHVRTAPRTYTRAVPGPRTHVTHHRTRHVRTNYHVRANPWNRGFRGAHRPGYVWVDGCWTDRGWQPGFYRPVHHRAGYVWVNGYWDGWTYVDGYWRPAHRAGYIWVDGYYNGRTWVGGHWSVRGRTVIYR